MKRIYHFYLTCMTLTLTMPMMIVSVFAVDDMWTVANNIIRCLRENCRCQHGSGRADVRCCGDRRKAFQ